MAIASEAATKERKEVLGLIKRVNERLEAAGSEGAEHMFGIGCAIGGIPVLAIVLIMYGIGMTDLILTLIILVIGALGVTGLTTLVSRQARARRIRDAYQNRVRPEIELILRHQSLNRQQFDQLADEILPPDAPLRAFLYNQATTPLETDQE